MWRNAQVGIFHEVKVNTVELDSLRNLIEELEKGPEFKGALCVNGT